jgi:hypothetical protein
MNKKLFDKIGFIALFPNEIKDDIYYKYIDLYYYIFKKEHYKLYTYSHFKQVGHNSIIAHIEDITVDIRGILDKTKLCDICFKYKCNCYYNKYRKIYKVFNPKIKEHLWTIFTEEEYETYLHIVKITTSNI